MLFQWDWAISESCLWRTDVGWFENTYPSLCTDISDNTEVYILAVELSWLVTGIAFFSEFTLTVWISGEYAGPTARLCWPRSVEGVWLPRCIIVSVAACFAIPCPKHFSYLLPLTVHPPVSLVTVMHTVWSVHVHVLRSSSFMKNKLPPWKTVGTSSATRFSEVFSAHLWATTSSKAQRLSKHYSLQPRKELKLVARLPLWKGQNFPLSSFQKPFLCCPSKTFSIPFQGCFILWVGYGVCLQGVLHV